MTSIVMKANWQALDQSRNLKKSKIKNYNFKDNSLIGFRSKNGEAHVFDAYCPHLGAHLGIGGRVENDELICPFHGWRFGFDGACKQIPYCQKIPPKAALRKYETMESEGILFFNHESLRL